MALRLPLRRSAVAEMTLAGHLAELRRRVIVSALAVGAGAVVAFVLYESILSFFVAPYCHIVPVGQRCALYVTGPLDGLSIRFRIAVWGGVVLALPVLLWQLWRFVTPGLHAHEKRYAIPFVGASLVFFGLGGGIAWLTFPHALRWLSSIGGPSLQSIYDPSSYLRLIILLIVVFGVAFEFPVLLVALQAARVVRPATLAARRRWAIVAVFGFAAIATPSSDPFSMLVLALPLCLFYELSILVGRLLRR
ncbi:MAG TPA: twin-arginine translocase subunit TatC [Acidimicrobiales bacterium]|nr:twin-arginine translocase subunit TatC [Acidimicrobiales bacterium]